MPSIYTHTHFAKDVKRKLTKENINIGNNTLYEIFSQSFDFLFYYNFPLIIPGANIRNFGNYCHRNNCQEYIINIIKYMKKQNNYTPELFAYLYGSINHYALDSVTHPYINYLSKKDGSKSAHTKIEFNIDAYYYELDTKQKFYKYKIYNDLQKKVDFSPNLKKAIDNVYYTTFNKKNIGKIYEKSYNQSRNLFKIFLYDPRGVKKKLYQIIDKIFPFISHKLEYRSLNIKQIDLSFLNTEKKSWNNINNSKKKFNYSWQELYNRAIETSVTMIKSANNFLNNKITLAQLQKSIPNITYSNGRKLS